MRFLPGRPASVRSWINNTFSSVHLAVEKGTEDTRSTISQNQRLAQCPVAKFETKNGACTTHGCVTEKLGILSWQLTMPSVSRRCPDSSVIRASISYVLHYTPWQDWEKWKFPLHGESQKRWKMVVPLESTRIGVHVLADINVALRLERNDVDSVG